MEPVLKVVHIGRGVYKIRLDCGNYQRYIRDSGYSVDEINRAYKIYDDDKIYFSDFYKIICKYLNTSRNHNGVRDKFTKENAIKAKEELEALITIKKLIH